MRRGAHLPVAVAIGLSALATPGIASEASRKADDAAYARKIMRNFAKCNVKYEHQLSRQFVLMSPAEWVSPDELQRVANPKCLGLLPGRLVIPRFYYRAALAEELYRRELAGRPPLNPTESAPLDWTGPTVTAVDAAGRPRDPVVLRAMTATAARDATVGRLGECVVRSSPSGALTVLNTKPESEGELLALKSLTLSIGRCIKGGQTATFNRTNLRAAIVLSYYRLAMEAGPDQAVGVAR